MFFYKVISCLERNGIPYILTGGYALSLHGYVRQTFDIDFMIDTDLTTLVEVEYAMREINLVPEKFSPQSIDKLKGVEQNWIFRNPFDETEIVDFHLGFKLDEVDTELKTIQTYRVPIVGIADLIEIKSKSLNPQDQADLKVLKELL